jgi:hypothetical protein
MMSRYKDNLGAISNNLLMYYSLSSIKFIVSKSSILSTTKNSFSDKGHAKLKQM